jgi:hypothetical protein
MAVWIENKNLKKIKLNQIERTEHFSADERNVTHKFTFQNEGKLQQRSLMLPAGKIVECICEK